MTDGTSDTGTNIEDPSEPSMEDILASIRQLIADDDSVLSSGEGPAPIENTEIDNGLGTDDIVASLTSEALILDNPLEDQFIEQEKDALSGLSVENDAGSNEDSLQIPEIEVVADDISLDDVLTNISDDFELQVPTEKPNILPSDDIMGDLMGDILGDNSSAVMDEKVDENILTSTVDDVLSDNSPADSFDTDIDEILADIVDNQGETDGIDLVDFDENSSDIESILSDMSGDLAASPEITAVTESLVEPEITLSLIHI